MTNQSKGDGEVHFLNEAAVREVLRYEDLIPAMERALVDFSAGKVAHPVRGILPANAQGVMGLMPAAYGDFVGAKLVTFFPQNGALGLPTHQALIVMFRRATGEPLAVLDGRLITEMRTAAVSAVATRLLAPPEARSLAILGSGVQARAHVKALRLVRDLEEVRVWSRDLAHAEALARELGAATAVRSAQDAVREADVVVTVTASRQPILQGAWLKPGVLVCAVGGVGQTVRELDDSAMQGAVIVDSREAAMIESGDILLARAPIYAELGELLAQKKAMPEAQHRVFKSLGLAVEDLAAAQLVLEVRQLS